MAFNVVRMTDENGQVVAAREYDAFGNILSESGDWSICDLGFQSNWIQMKDSGGSLYLTPSGRIYDTRIGRFLQRDPLRLRTGANRYAALMNAPTTHVDPAGLEAYGSKDFPHVSQSEAEEYCGECLEFDILPAACQGARVRVESRGTWVKVQIDSQTVWRRYTVFAKEAIEVRGSCIRCRRPLLKTKCKWTCPEVFGVERKRVKQESERRPPSSPVAPGGPLPPSPWGPEYQLHLQAIACLAAPIGPGGYPIAEMASEASGFAILPPAPGVDLGPTGGCSWVHGVKLSATGD